MLSVMRHAHRRPSAALPFFACRSPEIEPGRAARAFLEEGRAATTIFANRGCSARHRLPSAATAPV
jgi:hypothetical protein